MRRTDAKAVYTLRTSTEAGMVPCLGGARYAHVGDLLVTDKAGTTVDVLAPEGLSASYEPLEEGALTLTSAHVARLGKVVRFGATQSADDLVQAVEGLASVSIGGVRIDWTPGQVAELKRRADKQGWSVEKYVQFLVNRFTQDMWTLV